MQNPEIQMQAENMAVHFQNTRRDLRRKKGLHARDWKTLSREDKQELIEIFTIILSAAQNIQQNEPLAKRGSFKSRI